MTLRNAGRLLLSGEAREVGELRELGGAYAKSRVEGVFRGGLSYEKGRGKELRLVIKNVGTGYDFSYGFFGEEEKSTNPARRYYERWRFLRSIGMPTASSMRVVDDRRVAMGDMTLGGAAFFGKEKEKITAQEKRRGVRRELNETEKAFLGIDPQKIKQEIVRWQVFAWENGFRLPGDDEYDLRVWPDGRFQVLVLDLTGMRKRRDEKMDVLNGEQRWLFSGLDHLFAGLKKIGGVK